MRIQIASEHSTSVLGRHFASRGYRTHWQEYEVFLIISLDIRYYVHDNKQITRTNILYKLGN